MIFLIGRVLMVSILLLILLVYIQLRLEDLFALPISANALPDRQVSDDQTALSGPPESEFYNEQRYY